MFYFEGVLLNDIALEKKDSGGMPFSFVNFKVSVALGSRKPFVIDCEAWGITAEKLAIGYAKGSVIAIEGDLEMKNTRVWFHPSHYSECSEEVQGG